MFYHGPKAVKQHTKTRLSARFWDAPAEEGFLGITSGRQTLGETRTESLNWQGALTLRVIPAGLQMPSEGVWLGSVD